MKFCSKWPRPVFFFCLFGLFSLNGSVLGAGDEQEPKRPKLGSTVSSSGDLVVVASLPQTIIQREWVLEEKSSLWKQSLDFSQTPYSPSVPVDDWHQAGSKVLPAIQKGLADVSHNSWINVAIAGLQCIYRKAENDVVGVTKIINLPKLFVSGCKAPRLANFNEFIDKYCSGLSAEITPIVQAIKTMHNGFYGVGDGYIYSAFDTDYSHLRCYIEQNFNLWRGESSHLCSTYLQSRLQIIKRDGPNNRYFSENYFHSEQAILSYLDSEAGIEYVFRHVFDHLPKTKGSPQVIQLVLHINSYYDSCESCSSTLFRECEVGRMFLKKFGDRLKSQHYLYPHNDLLLLVETSGLIAYRNKGGTTRPAGFESGDSFTVPLISTQVSPYVVRTRIK